MKPNGQRWHLHDKHQLNAFVEWIQGQWAAGKKPTVQMLKHDRTTHQNSMFYAMYGAIATQAEDKSTLDVRRECKLHYGIPILRASDPAFCKWYDNSIKGLTYEDKLLLMTYMDVTSLFTKEQATEYLDTIISEYTKMGYALADPRQDDAA